MLNHKSTNQSILKSSFITRGRIIQHLPRLKQLDLLEIAKEERLEAGVRNSSDNDDDADNDDGTEGQGDNGHGKSG